MVCVSQVLFKAVLKIDGNLTGGSCTTSPWYRINFGNGTEFLIRLQNIEILLYQIQEIIFNRLKITLCSAKNAFGSLKDGTTLGSGAFHTAIVLSAPAAP